MSISRRHFLKGSAAVGVAASYAGLVPVAMAQEPHFRFPTRPVDRLAITSYPFRALMKSPENPTGMDVVQFAKMAIEKFNIHNINPLGKHVGSTDPHDLEKLRKEVEGAGSRFVGLGLSGWEFYSPDPAVRKASVESVKQWIDTAAILGSPSVRPHLGPTKGAKPSIALAAGSLGELADYGARKNIVVNLENDNLVDEDIFLIVKIIEKANNPYLRALPDMGNSVRAGNAKYNDRGLQMMYRHAFNMSHVKAESTSKTGAVYKVDLAKTFGIAKASGYKGFFSMEQESKSDDVFAGTHNLVVETLRYLS